VTGSEAPKPDKKPEAWDRPVGGLRGAWAFLCSLPERLKRPESLLMLMAILASFGVHMPPWVGLGALADYFQKHEAERERAKPVEVSFEVSEPAKPAEPVVAPPEPTKSPSKHDKHARREKPEPEKPKVERVPPPEEPKKEEPNLRVSELTLPKPAEPAPAPEPTPQRKQSITQKSVDPNVEPPPNAEYLAEENQRVAEETVAKVTSETKNDPDVQAAAPEAPGPEKSGDSLEQERGAEHGGETQELKAQEARAAQPPPSANQPTPRPAQPSREARNEVAPETIVVHDPLGSFVINAPRPAQSGQRGQAGKAGAAATQPNIKVSWSAFEQTYGAEQLAQDRMPREAKRRGAGHEKRWNEFRASVENYIAGVKPGNMTALNAAADPFAMYLAAFHRNLHTEFAYEFIGSLPLSGALADMNLVAKVEIVVNPDGTLDRVGVVKSSGNLMYDFGAFNAVQRGAPYPIPPEKIRSPDGRTYMRWALHRNESQCGTWNAEPYILKNPPRSPNDPKQDNVSPYRSPSEGEHGRRVPSNEPQPGKPGDHGPAVQPGDTLGSFRAKRRLNGPAGVLGGAGSAHEG
jgi:TonB family protein